MKGELVKYLKDRTALDALIDKRLFVHQAPQGAVAPYIVWRRLPDVDHHHHMLAAAGLVQEIFQFDVFSTTAKNVETVAEQLRLALDGFRGEMNGENVRSIHIVDEDDEKVNPTDGSDDSKFSIRQSYRVTHTESVPTFP